MSIAMDYAQAVGRNAGRAIRVRGLVQGVGFRPTVWRLARDCGLTGEVWNDAEGVMVEAWGEPAMIEAFMRRLKAESPPLARIDAIEDAPLERPSSGPAFQIVPSRAGEARTGVVPDAATCPQCLADILDPVDRRRGYPFTNCTHCGPRLSIIQAVPYDRASTSMAEFVMCPACRSEYDDPEDRRFHAQPTACPACGPRAWLERLDDARAEPVVLDCADPIGAAAQLLRYGAIVAIKGLGGFHLACNACDGEAVRRLRLRKRRYAKPFALMARDVGVIRRYCAVGAQEEALLMSSAAPIVIMSATGRERVANAVAPGQTTLGFMLPYTPLHHLLLRTSDRPLVMTSGNFSDEPQCIDAEEARRSLSAIAEYGLFHDRRIVNRVDDSVARVMGGEPRLLRRARGYAPAPFKLPDGFERATGVLALGGELKNTFCLVKDGQAILSQHIGDLEDAIVFDDFRNTLSLYGALFDHDPQVVAVDMHPDYFSTKLGREEAVKKRWRIEEVQHHHAHIASCLVENGAPLDAPPVLGVALDGTGLGPDGSLWGGEFLLADYTRFERLGCFTPVAMPGGAQAVRQPWRNTFAHLESAIGWERCKRSHGGLELIRFLDSKPAATLLAMMRKGINSPASSSCGRLFDAVAAALGVCREEASYEGQAACELESLVDERALPEIMGYPITIGMPSPDSATGPLPTLDFRAMWRALLDDLAREAPVGVMAARFHVGLVHGIVGLALLLLKRKGQRSGAVALSGGSFQNRLLFEGVSRALKNHGLKVLTQSRSPSNDGGLALGQAAIAAARVIRARSNNGGLASCA